MIRTSLEELEKSTRLHVAFQTPEDRQSFVDFVVNEMGLRIRAITDNIEAEGDVPYEVIVGPQAAKSFRGQFKPKWAITKSVMQETIDHAIQRLRTQVIICNGRFL